MTTTKRTPQQLAAFLKSEVEYSEQHKDAPVKPGTRISRMQGGLIGVVDQRGRIVKKEGLVYNV